MDIKINCPNCGQHILVDSTAIGQQAASPTCSKPFTITPAPPAMTPGTPPLPTTQAPMTKKTGLAVASLICGIGSFLGFGFDP